MKSSHSGAQQCFSLERTCIASVLLKVISVRTAVDMNGFGLGQSEKEDHVKRQLEARQPRSWVPGRG